MGWGGDRHLILMPLSTTVISGRRGESGWEVGGGGGGGGEWGVVTAFNALSTPQGHPRTNGRGGGGGISIIKSCQLHRVAEFRSCVKVEVDVLGFRPVSLTVSAGVKRH